MTYIIIDNGQPSNGEFYDDVDRVCRALAFERNRSVLVASVDLAEFAKDGAASLRDVTEDMVRTAYECGWLTSEHPLVAEHLSLPITRDEHLGNVADTTWANGEAA